MQSKKTERSECQLSSYKEEWEQVMAEERLNPLQTFLPHAANKHVFFSQSLVSETRIGLPGAL